MKKLIVILSMAMLGIGLIFFVGCSDDEETTQPVVKQTGDPDDEEFEAAGEAFGIVEMFNGMMFGFTYELMDTIYNHPDFPGTFKPGLRRLAAGINGDSVYLTYHSDSKYWYFFLQVCDTSPGDPDPVIMTFTITDSLQFLHGSTAVQWPDSAQLTGLKHGAAVIITSSDGSGSAAAHQSASIFGDIPGMGDIEINGSTSFDIDFVTASEEPYCSFDININGSVTNVLMNLTDMENDGCPYSGRVSYNGTINIACVGDTNFTYNDHWTVVQTFDGDTINYVVENSTHRWVFDEACGGGGDLAAPENRVTEFINRIR